MKRTIMAAMVLSLAVGSLALADPPQGHHHDDGHWQDQHHPDHDYDHDHDRRYEHDEHGRHEHRGPMREHGYFNSGRYERPHGWYVHRWTYGERLPRAFWARDYWINDWWSFDLRTPPYGYEWVRYGDDALLVNIYTGEVLEVAYDVFD